MSRDFLEFFNCPISSSLCLAGNESTRSKMRPLSQKCRQQCAFFDFFSVSCKCEKHQGRRAGNPEERAHAFHILIRSDSVQQLSAAAGPACALPPASTGLAKSIGWELHEHCHSFMFANLRTVFALKNVNQEIPTDPAVMQPVPALSPSHVTSHPLFYRVV